MSQTGNALLEAWREAAELLLLLLLARSCYRQDGNGRRGLHQTVQTLDDVGVVQGADDTDM